MSNFYFFKIYSILIHGARKKFFKIELRKWTQHNFLTDIPIFVYSNKNKGCLYILMWLMYMFSNNFLYSISFIYCLNLFVTISLKKLALGHGWPKWHGIKNVKLNLQNTLTKSTEYTNKILLKYTKEHLTYLLSFN